MACKDKGPRRLNENQVAWGQVRDVLSGVKIPGIKFSVLQARQEGLGNPAFTTGKARKHSQERPRLWAGGSIEEGPR